MIHQLRSDDEAQWRALWTQLSLLSTAAFLIALSMMERGPAY